MFTYVKKLSSHHQNRSPTSLFTKKGQNLVADGQTSRRVFCFGNDLTGDIKQFLCDRLRGKINHVRNSQQLESGASNQYFPYEMRQFPQYPPRRSYPSLPSPYILNDRGNPPGVGGGDTAI